jgi:hypothetical protein
MTDDILLLILLIFQACPSEFGIKEKLFPSYLKKPDSMPLKKLVRF